MMEKTDDAWDSYFSSIISAVICIVVIYLILTIGYWLFVSALPRPYWMETPSLLDIINGQIKWITGLRVV